MHSAVAKSVAPSMLCELSHIELSHIELSHIELSHIVEPLSHIHIN